MGSQQIFDAHRKLADPHAGSVVDSCGDRRCNACQANLSDPPCSVLVQQEIRDVEKVNVYLRRVGNSWDNVVGEVVVDGWGAEIVDSLTPQPGDIVIEGKRGLDTFASTNLDFILRSLGIKTLVVAGFLTNCCVESTARTGYEKGFSVIALSDCAATLSEEEQRFTFEKNLPMFARILTHTEFLSETKA